MESTARKLDTHYTYADYLEWDTDERYELIEGEPYMMSPAPLRRHQVVVRELLMRFGNYLQGKTCEVYDSPIDVRLNADEGDDTVVQPDLLVVCDKKKLDRRGIKGAPDLVVEVISKSSESIDSSYKLGLYQKCGVRECWIVDPDANTVRVYEKDSAGNEMVRVYRENDILQVGIFPDMRIDLSEVFWEEALEEAAEE